MSPGEARCAHCGSAASAAVAPPVGVAPAAGANAARFERVKATPAYEAALRHVPPSATGAIIGFVIVAVMVMLGGLFFIGITLGAAEAIERVIATPATERVSVDTSGDLQPDDPAPTDAFHGVGRATSIKSFAAGMPTVMRAFLAVFGAGFFLMGVFLFRRMLRFARATPTPVLAAVLDKRTDVHRRSSRRSSEEYFVTFELPDGTRREVAVGGPLYGQVVAGDLGVAFWRADAVVDFVRLEAR